MMVFLLYRVAQNSWDSTDILRQPLKLKDFLSSDIKSSEASSPEPDIGGLTGAAAQEKEAAAKAKAKGSTSTTLDDDEDVDYGSAAQSKGSTFLDDEEDDLLDSSIKSQNPPKDQAATQKDLDEEDVIHWKPQKEHYPVPSGELISLPSGLPKVLPKVQFDFAPESSTAQEKRLARQKTVKTELERAWGGYRKFAWTHDELSPVSGKFKDPFCGWAATLVDSLDTLWIAGMTEEFEEAVKAAAKIDFTTTSKRDIPVFETTIRYLGGLIAAYDVSGGKYSVLLEKAVELAEILMGIFDTPNRMPILYYNWKPEFASQPQQAGRVGIAELGTLSMEFTRLAQITEMDKYYDAVARITDALVQFQAEQAVVPGMFPENLDASGCNKSATALRLSKEAQAQMDSEELRDAPQGFSPGGKKAKRDIDSTSPPTVEKRAPIGLTGDDDDRACVPQGLVSSSPSMEVYHVGGSQDSAYEYFPKEYILLGGLEDKYKKLHIDTIDAINKELMFRPMVDDPEGKWDLLFPARMTKYGSGTAAYRYEVTHLTCFVGGMYGLGGRIFGREDDVEIAKKLTDTCVWAYESTTSGIMPEGAEILPCPTLKKCEFNQTAWYAELDPSAEWRDQEVEKWEAKHKASTSSSKKPSSLTDDDVVTDGDRSGESTSKKLLDEYDDEDLDRLGDSAALREAQKLKAAKLKESAAKGDPGTLDKQAEAEKLAEAAANGVPEAITEVKYDKLLNKDNTDTPTAEDLDGLKGSKDRPKDNSMKSTKHYDEDASYKGTKAEDAKLKIGLEDEDNDYKIEKDPDAPKTDTMLDSEDPLIQAEAMERAKDALGEVDEVTTIDSAAARLLDYGKKVLKAPLIGKRDLSSFATKRSVETDEETEETIETPETREVEAEKPMSHKEYVEEKILNYGLPPGFTNIKNRGYILR